MSTYDAVITFAPDVTDHETIKAAIIQYMEDQGMEKSGHEEIFTLSELMNELEYEFEK